MLIGYILKKYFLKYNQLVYLRLKVTKKVN